MQNLAGRLAAVDESAGAAIDVIAYFDRLAQSRAGLEQVVRGAAVLAGVPARLVDPSRRIQVRVEPDGVRTAHADPPDPRWRWHPVGPDGTGRVVLETDRRASLVDDMVLERAAMLAELVISRVRRPGPSPGPDCAVVEVVVDPHVLVDERLRAYRELGLPAGARALVVAWPGGHVQVVAAGAPLPDAPRLGVGTAVDAPDLPISAARARTALRFSADDTADDPGARVVHADDLGGLELIAAAVDAGAPPTADLRSLRRAAEEIPHLVLTLTRYAASASIRAAAAALFVHHSTLQDRLDHAERLLGWDVRQPAGRLRLQMALAERLLRR
ncbi:helix-turn-helix domain-containing protein [Pseudonocardia zijingensis]|uniref:Helix-turn-helix domain-containing protein n=1 Tax=Pseudonocardia zijingensis TaxID=153376 RepID=A0ABN1P314_9PSEU